MKKSLLFKIMFFLLAVPFCSCTNFSGSPGGKELSEGTIEYDAMVVDQDNPMADLAPRKMIVKFKDNRSATQMSAGMGMFTTSFICNQRDMGIVQLVKLMNKKVAITMDSSAIKKEIALVPKMRINHLNETKLIAGYVCKKATVSFNNNEHESYDIYYTQDINIPKANWYNPYNSINGVLMEYRLKRYNMEMKFTAKTVKKEEIDDAEFMAPVDYTFISEREMNKLFESFQ